MINNRINKLLIQIKPCRKIINKEVNSLLPKIYQIKAPKKQINF